VQAASGKPILQVEADFTTQPGVPLLKVDEKDGFGLSQGRFAEDPATIASVSQQWHVPIAIKAGHETKTYLLDGANRTRAVTPGQGPVVLNAGQYAYLRALYPKMMMAALSTESGALDAADQLGILYDSWALGESGYEPPTDCLDFARSIQVSAEPAVWQQIIGTLEQIDGLYARNPNRAAFAAFAMRELRPLADKLGWDAHPGEDSNVTNLRNSVLTTLSRFGDQAVIQEARRRFEAAMDHPETMSPETRRVVIAIVARNADRPAIDRLMAAVRASTNPLERQHLFDALAEVADPGEAERVVQFATGPDAPAGSAPYILISIAREHPDVVWKMGLEYVSRPDAPIDSYMQLALMPAIAASSGDPRRIDDLLKYADKNIPPEARQEVESAIATIKLHAKFKSEHLPEIDRWLATN
jgi:aminopeptidase N